MINSEKVWLSIVIPIYNEEKRIKKSYEKVLDYLKNKSFVWEILMVNDGSTDDTVGSVNMLIKGQKNIKLLSLPRHLGKGGAVRAGMLKAKGEYILFSDADLSTPIKELNKLLKWLKDGYHIAIGSRGLPDSILQIHQPWYREQMGKIFNFFVRTLILRKIRDTQCGFKCFKKKVTYEIFRRQKLNGFSFDVEVLYIARKLGYRIKEVPILWLNFPPSKVSIIKGPIKMFFDLLRIRFLHLDLLLK